MSSQQQNGITLYWNIFSQPSRAVKTLIDIGRIPCTFTNVDLFRQEHKRKEYQQMYTLGKVPVMKTGDFVLGESGAIMIYLCERYPNLVKYYGQTLEERAITNQYISWYQNYFRPFMLAPVRLYMQAAFTKKPIQEHQQKTLIEGMFDVIGKLNEFLTKNRTKFIAGDRVTIADFLFFHQMTNLVYLSLEHDKYKQVKRWYGEVYSVPEVKAITHEWYQVAKKTIKAFQSVDIIRAKL